MKSSTPIANFRVPELSDSARSSVVALTGASVIAAICLLTVARTVDESTVRSSPGAAAIAALGAIAVLTSVARWVPSLSEESVRTVPRTHAAGLLASSVALGVAALALPRSRDAIVGVLFSVCILNVYLACWGYRSLFLLRRLILFSVLSWPAAAAVVHRYVAASLTGPSDLVYRRLTSFGVASADEHPWRVLSAMSEHATVAVVGVVVLTLAASRLRVSVPAVVRLAVGSFVAMVAHHAFLLAVPLESYEQSWWAQVAAGPTVEIALAAVVAIGLFSSATALTSDDLASTPSPDRDPAIFGAHDIAAPATSMRFCALVLPAALLARAVVQS